jgi:hypothetical protein
MNASFSTVASNTDSFHWKESRDNGGNWTFVENGTQYSGTHTNQLTLLNVPITFNGYLYQCMLSNGTCITNSANTILSVDSILSTGNNQTEPNIYLTNQPNPFSDFTRIEYFLSQDGIVHLEIFSIFGQRIFDYPASRQKRGQYSIVYKNPVLQNGLYLCKMEFYNEFTHYSLIKKMVKE